MSFPPPGRVVGSKSLACRATRPAAAERTSWRRRRLRCATQTDGAACRRERYAARPRRARARLRVLRLRAALKRRSAFMTCMSGTLGQSTTHGDGRDDAPLCKNASAGCPTFWAVPSNPPPESPCQRGPNPAGWALSHPPNHPSLHVCPDVRRRDHSKATYYLAEVMRARARHSLAGDGRSHPLPILQRKFLAIFSYSSLRLVVLVSDRPGGVPVPI